jgi:hypothetical protein
MRHLIAFELKASLHVRYGDERVINRLTLEACNAA